MNAIHFPCLQHDKTLLEQLVLRQLQRVHPAAFVKKKKKLISSAINCNIKIIVDNIEYNFYLMFKYWFVSKLNQRFRSEES